MKVVIALCLLIVAVETGKTPVSKAKMFRTVKKASMGIEHSIKKLAERVKKLEKEADVTNEELRGSRAAMKNMEVHMDQIYERMEGSEAFSENLQELLLQLQTYLDNVMQSMSEGGAGEGMEQAMMMMGDIQKQVEGFGVVLGQHGTYLKKAFDWMKLLQSQVDKKADKTTKDHVGSYVGGLVEKFTDNGKKDDDDGKKEEQEQKSSWLQSDKAQKTKSFLTSVFQKGKSAWNKIGSN